MIKKIWILLILFLLTGCDEIIPKEYTTPPDYTIAVYERISNLLPVIEHCAVDSDRGFFEIELFSAQEISLESGDLVIVKKWSGETPEYELKLSNDKYTVVAAEQPAAGLMDVIVCLQSSAVINELRELDQ